MISVVPAADPLAGGPIAPIDEPSSVNGGPDAETDKPDMQDPGQVVIRRPAEGQLQALASLRGWRSLVAFGYVIAQRVGPVKQVNPALVGITTNDLVGHESAGVAG